MPRIAATRAEEKPKPADTLVQRMIQRYERKKPRSTDDCFTLKPYKYSDDHHKAPTDILISTSEKLVSGKFRWELQRCRKLRPKEFKRGFVMVSTRYELQKKMGPSNGRLMVIPKIIIFDIDFFIKLFSHERQDLHDTLKTQGDLLVSDWNTRNKSTGAYNRVPFDTEYQSDPFYYKDAQGIQHESKYCFGITTYGYTSRIQHMDQCDEITFQDLTFTLKLRTSERSTHWVDSDPAEPAAEPADDPELGFVKNGYTAPLIHFLSMLESPTLTHFMTYVEKTFQQRKELTDHGK